MYNHLIVLPLLLDFFLGLLFVDWVLTDGSMSLFVHSLNLKQEINTNYMNYTFPGLTHLPRRIQFRICVNYISHQSKLK